MTTHLERAIEQIQDSRNSHPEVDWTQHTLEDGNVVSTQERVVKDVCRTRINCLLVDIHTWASLIGSGAGNVQAYSGTIFR